ncbi:MULTISPECIES: HNH endonuclease [unclassified Mesorhizobium]|uniref:HNH endonuclease n=1 Tax=unclassified Mesorhizobium TaxID=325217 RepID=UPI00112AC62A|nr:MULTISPECIES: HNH endonuclease [unclassified Mesorhizobium]TPM62085.1 HNH endonuclease [Mesorhizobium sp. B2-2-1]TPN68456.1 HNH endonuclease [Mesorhizobium sp. B1-1-3]
MIDQATLRDRIDYDPTTGVFRWKSTTAYQERRIGQIAGWIDTHGHRVIEIDGIRYKAGRLAFMYMLGRWPTNEADHKNRKPSDNRWRNLRDATRADNNVNRVRQRKSDLPRGVDRNKAGFMARCRRDGVVHHLGTFSTPREAGEAYTKFAKRLHGEFLPEAVA